MYTISPTSQFKKDFKRAEKQGKDLNKLGNVLIALLRGKALPQKYFDHQLTGEMREYRECHLEPDWLLIYQLRKEEKVVTLIRIGSHSELFS
ncbi:type II toxin-antitoxin system YafQ family toxin [Oscillatoriales cyanobacterium LEGE 11467]|uniref:Type II toxin-antitoxin system YafQ family toxin n=2 Tax=Zarconia TaxID=2992130 RepID=A0A928Z9I3_9CYAN|nr:type II toxin-antitoxin system YafQ family toxin [Zarconia navalis LEGE 11467]